MSLEGAPARRRRGLAGQADPRLLLATEGTMFPGELAVPPPAHPGLGNPRANPQRLFLPWKVELCN